MTPGSRMRQALAYGRAHPLATAEILVAIALTSRVLLKPGLLAFTVGLVVAAARGTLSGISLLTVDTWGTLATFGTSALMAALTLGPVVRLARHWPAYRWVWLPLSLIPTLAILSTGVPAISTPVMWVLLAVAFAIGFEAAGRRWLGWLAFAPAVVCLEPALSHSPISDRLWTTERLAPRCATNDGERPVGFTPDMAVSRYYAVTPVSPDLAIATGDRRAFWMTRNPGGRFALESPSRARGNLWQGCVLGNAVFFTKNHHYFRVERLPAGSPEPERFTDFESPDPPGVSELDLAEPACDPKNDRVFSTEVFAGGIRELSPADGSQRRFVVGGLNLQYMRRRDGMLVGIDTARLVVFDPDAGRVLEEHAAGLGVMGIDVCMVDDAVATTDMTGRVRIFERGASGEYAFHDGVALPAPRRIAFSPDCRMVGVTSADDHTVWSLRRADLSIAKRYHLGPGLRDVTFTGPREMAVADACMATFLDAGE